MGDVYVNGARVEAEHGRKVNLTSPNGQVHSLTEEEIVETRPPFSAAHRQVDGVALSIHHTHGKYGFVTVMCTFGSNPPQIRLGNGDQGYLRIDGIKIRVKHERERE